jgi:hypothetical protein
MFALPVSKPQTKAATTWTSQLAHECSALITHRHGDGSVEQARMPQRTIGNQATLRLLAQRAGSLTGNEHSNNEQGAERLTSEAPVTSWDFNKIPPYPPDRASRSPASSRTTAASLPGAIQAKLVVGQSSDPLEDEADRVADQIIRMPDPEFSIAGTLPQASRKCAAREEAALTKRWETPETAANVAIGLLHEALRSDGQPLDTQSRAFFEPRFGYNFSLVRVYDDATAAESARSIGALAYTAGSKIAFGAGHYQPGTSQGRKLIAHELAHVVQQRDGNGAGPSLCSRTERGGQEVEKPGQFRPLQIPRFHGPPAIRRQEDAGAPVAKGVNALNSIAFWLNAFIPNSVCTLKGSLFAITVPEPGIHPTEESARLSLVRFFTGDQREFSDDPTASARMHSGVRIEALSSKSPSLASQRQIVGESQEVDGHGKIINRATARADRMQFFNLRGSQTVDPHGGVVEGVPGSAQIDVAGSAALPLLPFAPDIDYSGTLIIDRLEGNVIFRGAVSGFPAFEMYFKANDGPTVTLAEFQPRTPLDLIGEENRPVDAATRIVL